MTTDGGLRRDELLTAHLAATPGVERAMVSRIELAPGTAPGRHTHPCDVVGIVLAGRIRFHLDGSMPTVLEAGYPFFEPRDTVVLQFDNDSDDEPAVFLACYLLQAGQTELIEMAPYVSGW